VEVGSAVAPRDFVPVELLQSARIAAPTPDPATPTEPALPDLAALPGEPGATWAERTTLFGDLET
jgi:hypothetical protein